MAGASAGNQVRKASKMAQQTRAEKRSIGSRIADGARNVVGRVRRFFS